MNKFVNTLSHVADIGGVPLFAWLTIYFYRKKHKTLQEGILMTLFFTFHYL
jgi:hypothetical protein